VLHEGMLCDLIQGHCYRGPKVAKMAHFKIFSTSIHVIKRLMVKYSKTVLKNSPLDLFLIVFLLRHYMTVKVRLLQQLQSTAQHNLTLEDAVKLALNKPLWRLLSASGATH